MQENEWHEEVISEDTRGVLRQLRQESIVARFYLAGGTGLALRLGHRRSLDLDFFTDVPFNEEALLGKIQKLRAFSLIAKDKATLHAHIQGTKVSFLGYSYPVLFPFTESGGVRVADARDIACMKISALAGRGTKRDFVDVYFASQRFGLGALLELFGQKFGSASYSMLHVLKSLTYFDEAEKDPMPDMLVALAWEEVKAFFVMQAPNFLKR